MVNGLCAACYHYEWRYGRPRPVDAEQREQARRAAEQRTLATAHVVDNARKARHRIRQEIEAADALQGVQGVRTLAQWDMERHRWTAVDADRRAIVQRVVMLR